MTTNEADYEARVTAWEAEGLTRSDAQAVVEAEDMMPQYHLADMVNGVLESFQTRAEAESARSDEVLMGAKYEAQHGGISLTQALKNAEEFFVIVEGNAA